ncbi:peroxide stress protein YaaA [Actinoplanes sp. TBRC 11911]|uniref:peroxide stress protein YaaA n=1 Tax=Actinoplanes sp. TBRC 11911 TaxID=2729386 RepID=UPI00145CBA58|nr:peroxide stress protein YaaA [Actinoplanes sp. TBRC 11911]NMO56597.1 peroxide stress protein YaaA [Actinoplanes sp. TBRC 11911]
MLILLPPSEGKTPPVAGDPVDPASLWLPTLAGARRRVMSRLVALCRRTSARSVAETSQILGIGDGLRHELGRNAELPMAPAGPAAEVYTGVLYDALDPAGLTPEARDWVDRSAVVFSGLWGVVRLDDRIPAYRCSVGVTLPGSIGGLTAYWKKALTPALKPRETRGPILDLRSGAYAAMWSPPADGSATVRVLHERTVDGTPKRSIVSHFNKATKGRLVRDLAESGSTPETIDEVVGVLRDLKYRVEEQPAKAGHPRQLDVIVAEL